MSPGLAKDQQRHCAPLRGSRLDRLPPISNPSSASCHITYMIAPTACRRKGASDDRAEIIARRIVRDPLPGKKCSVTGSLAEIIIRPNFRPATALLDCDKQSLRWPGPFSSGFLSPQPPGAVGIGPVRRIVYPHPGPAKVGPFSFGGMLSFRGALARARNLLPIRSECRACAKRRIPE